MCSFMAWVSGILTAEGGFISIYFIIYSSSNSIGVLLYILVLCTMYYSNSNSKNITINFEKDVVREIECQHALFIPLACFTTTLSYQLPR